MMRRELWGYAPGESMTAADMHKIQYEVRALAGEVQLENVQIACFCRLLSACSIACLLEMDLILLQTLLLYKKVPPPIYLFLLYALLQKELISNLVPYHVDSYVRMHKGSPACVVPFLQLASTTLALPHPFAQ